MKSLLFLIALSIAINYFPTSLEQKNQTDNTNATHHHIFVTTNDPISTTEPVTNASFVEIDREKTLEQQVTDLKQVLRDEQILSGIIGVAGILASLWAYRRGKRDLQTIARKIIKDTIDAINADSRIKGESDKGQVGINDDGKVIAQNKRAISEPHVPVGDDSIGIKVIKANEKKDDASEVKS